MANGTKGPKPSAPTYETKGPKLPPRTQGTRGPRPTLVANGNRGPKPSASAYATKGPKLPPRTQGTRGPKPSASVYATKGPKLPPRTQEPSGTKPGNYDKRRYRSNQSLFSAGKRERDSSECSDSCEDALKTSAKPRKLTYITKPSKPSSNGSAVSRRTMKRTVASKRGHSKTSKPYFHLAKVSHRPTGGSKQREYSKRGINLDFTGVF